jgi:thioredoxin reductase (NADPH)
MYAKQWITSVVFGLMVINFSGCLGDRVSTAEYQLAGITFNDDTVPVVILGGGIAGLTAAYYCAQARIPCLVIEGAKPGGALSQSHAVRNWPGVLSAPGKDIADSIRNQALHWGVRIVQERVTSIDCKQWPRVIETQDVLDTTKTRTVHALAVIIAMGTEPNFLGVPGEWGADGYWGRGVTNCAVCEGSLCKGKEVVVVGGGDAAITETDYLSGIASKVTILVRKDSFNKAKDTAARDAVLARSNVAVLFNTEVKRMHGDGKQLTHLTLFNNKTGQSSTFNTSALFLAIGSKPNTALFKGQLELDEHGTIACKLCQQSSVEGVYAAGDIADRDGFMQAITAAGDATKATLQAIRFLKKIGYQVTAAAPAMPKPGKGVGGMAEEQGRVDEKPVVKPVAKPTAKPVTKPQEKPSVYAPEELRRDAASPAAPKPPKGLGGESEGQRRAEVHAVHELKTMGDLGAIVLKSSTPVVIDLFATWCMPCQRMLPIIDKLATEMAGRITFVKVNVDNQALDLDEILSTLGSDPVKGVPTFLFVKDGKEVGRVVGGRSEQQFKNEIEGALG